MAPARHGRNTRAYRRMAARVRRDQPICWLCGQYIDPDLPPGHRMAATSDHIDPLSLDGDILGEQRAAHRACNSRRGNGTKPGNSTTPTEQPRSTTW